jgi:hypothetical protein
LATPSSSFPQADIETRLRSWWQRKTASPLRRTPDPKRSGGTVFDILPEVSSTEAVEVFLEVEPLLGFKLRSSGVIKPGGYRSVDQFVQDLLPRLEAKYLESNPSVDKIQPQSPGGARAHAS